MFFSYLKWKFSSDILFLFDERKRIADRISSVSNNTSGRLMYLKAKCEGKQYETNLSIRKHTDRALRRCKRVHEFVWRPLRDAKKYLEYLISVRLNTLSSHVYKECKSQSVTDKGNYIFPYGEELLALLDKYGIKIETIDGKDKAYSMEFDLKKAHDLIFSIDIAGSFEPVRRDPLRLFDGKVKGLVSGADRERWVVIQLLFNSRRYLSFFRRAWTG